MTAAPSNKSMRSEAEYISSNNHHPFNESKGAININPCKDGKDCNTSVSAIKKTGKNNGTKKPAGRVSMAAGKQEKEGRYQVHLKREDGDINETIEYNVEYPNRVSVRMEYLMQSTKVRLNDRVFMNKLYDKLIEDEDKKLDKSTKMRQASERNRVKKLVIDGLMPPPNDMLHLYHHPVFRVNAMLRRLDQHDKQLYTGPKIKGKITPMEPYEFDGDKFFKQLHENGTYYVPSNERLDQEEKVAGKIARAKLRLMEKRKKETDEAKAMRLLYATEHAGNDENDLEFYGEEEDGENTSVAIEEKRKRQIARLKEKLQEKSEKNAARFKRKQTILENNEKKRRDRVMERQKERDHVFLEERETERVRIIESHRLRMTNKTLTNLKAILNDDDEPLASRECVIDYKAVFRQPDTPPTLKEDASFKRIREVFRVKGGNMLSKYSPSSNPTIARYIDTVKNADELFHFGNELSDLYNREQSKADDFLVKLNRLI